jgi:hypothetical protein
VISQNSTFGQCLDSGYEIYVCCESSSHCHHGKKLDLEAMAAKYGRDHGTLHADLIKLRWKCEKCGGRKVSFRYQPGGIQYARKDGPGKPEGIDPDVPF